MATTGDKQRRKNESKGDEDEKKPVSNAFANDGSFLEQFKKKMEETKTLEEKKGKRKEPKSAPATAETERKEEAAQAEAQNFVTSFMGGLKGKRKSLMKAKPPPSKRKKEKDEEDHRDKPDAWKAYMAEVEKYKAMSCSDDTPHKRPLVK